MTFDDFKEQLHNLGVFKRSTSARIVFDKLQETYAKPVEMSKVQVILFIEFKARNEPFKFIYEHIQFHNIVEHDLMHAWLHPELIVVKE